MNPLPTTPAKPILLAACGNLLAGDDAFGPLVLAALEARWPPEAPIRNAVELLDLSIAPAALLDALPGRSALVLVDAVEAGPAARDLIDLPCDNPRSLPLLLRADASTHGMGLAWQLRLAGELALLPAHARLIAQPIEGAGVGEPQSPHLAEAVRNAADAADRWCHAFASLICERSSRQSTVAGASALAEGVHPR